MAALSVSHTVIKDGEKLELLDVLVLDFSGTSLGCGTGFPDIA